MYFFSKSWRNCYDFLYFSPKIRRKILSLKVCDTWLNLNLFTANKSQRSSIVHNKWMGLYRNLAPFVVKSVSKSRAIYTRLKLLERKEPLFPCEENSSVVIRFTILLRLSSCENVSGLSRNVHRVTEHSHNIISCHIKTLTVAVWGAAE